MTRGETISAVLLVGAGVLTQPVCLCALQGATGNAFISDCGKFPAAVADSLDAGASYDLDELVVTASKPLVQSDGAKTVYNVDEDPSAGNMTALDLLRKVPGVMVDAQDNISVNGQSDFKIYIDGKANPVLTANASTILKSMPASSFAKVEVMTEPGARYDAEGTGGILNFVTRLQSGNGGVREGYAVSADISASNRAAGAGVSASLSRKRFQGSLNMNYVNGQISDQKYEGVVTTDYSDGGRMHELTRQRTQFNYLGGGFNTQWRPDSVNRLTAGWSFYRLWVSKFTMDQHITHMAPDGVQAWRYRNSGTGNLDNFSTTAEVSYEHTFSPSHMLTAAYRFDYGRNPIDLLFEVSETDNYSPAWRFRRSVMTSYTREHTAQIDYTLPLGNEKHMLETGVKGLFRRNNSDSREYNGDSGGNLPIVRDESVWLRQFQDIGAVYAAYSMTLNHLSAKAGVRYEHTRMGIGYRDDDRRGFTTHLNDVVPNVAVSWSFSAAHSLRLSYQMRISRPTVEQVNPYRLKLTDTQIREGNPGLRSERSNKVSLTYTNFARVLGGNVGVEYVCLDNMISQRSYMDGNGIVSTYGNYGRMDNISLQGYLNWNIIKDMSLGGFARGGYVRFSETAHGARKDGWSFNFNAQWSYVLPGKVRCNAYGGWSTRTLDIQGSNGGWYHYGAGVSRSFLAEDALTLSLMAANFAQSGLKNVRYMYGDGFEIRRENMIHNWTVGISLTWRFGNLNSSVEKRTSKIDNDDKSDTGAGMNPGVGVL